jgi:EH domain-containing protein 1
VPPQARAAHTPATIANPPSTNPPQACRWCAARADMVFLLFDPFKLGMSDEFKSAIAALAGHEDKVRVVLNRADTVAPQQLMRVYDALLWSLTRVLRTPEVCRCAPGSGNSGPRSASPA